MKLFKIKVERTEVDVKEVKNKAKKAAKTAGKYTAKGLSFLGSTIQKAADKLDRKEVK